MTFPEFQDDLGKEMIGKFFNGIAHCRAKKWRAKKWRA